eukprot:7391664-Prymnesium_polylepis.1
MSRAVELSRVREVRSDGTNNRCVSITVEEDPLSVQAWRVRRKKLEDSVPRHVPLVPDEVCNSQGNEPPVRIVHSNRQEDPLHDSVAMAGIAEADAHRLAFVWYVRARHVFSPRVDDNEPPPLPKVVCLDESLACTIGRPFRQIAQELALLFGVVCERLRAVALFVKHVQEGVEQLDASHIELGQLVVRVTDGHHGMHQCPRLFLDVPRERGCRLESEVLSKLCLHEADVEFRPRVSRHEVRDCRRKFLRGEGVLSLTRHGLPAPRERLGSTIHTVRGDDRQLRLADLRLEGGFHLVGAARIGANGGDERWPAVAYPEPSVRSGLWLAGSVRRQGRRSRVLRRGRSRSRALLCRLCLCLH